jgi:hypothetical protein
MATAAEALIRHLISSQVDNPDHIHLISPLTQSYELLMAAAVELTSRPRADIERDVKATRSRIESYRPLVAEVVRQRDKANRFERALNEIAYEHPVEPERIARQAIGDEP